MKNNILVPTLNSNLEGNGAWCASFDLVWKEFQTKFLGEGFEYNKANKTIQNLIDEAEKNLQVKDKDCFVKSGKMTVELKKEIIKAIKKKFKAKSDILDKFEFSKDKNTDMYFIYSLIKFALKFEKKFEKSQEKIKFGKNQELVDGFGIFENKQLKDQAYPIFYKSSNDFAVRLQTKEEKDIILFRTDDSLTFEEAFKKINETVSEERLDIRSLAVPNLKIDLIQEYEELCGEKFIRKIDNENVEISKAIQSLKFELDNEGASVKSEAAIAVKFGSAFNPTPKVYRDFLFDDTFYLFIVENNNPIVSLRVEDIKDFCE